VISEPEVTKLRLKSEYDFITLVSSGVLSVLDTPEILKAMWSNTSSLAHRNEAIIQAALDAGATKNLTALSISLAKSKNCKGTPEIMAKRYFKQRVKS